MKFKLEDIASFIFEPKKFQQKHMFRKTTPTPADDQQRPPGGAPPQFGTSGLDIYDSVAKINYHKRG